MSNLDRNAARSVRAAQRQTTVQKWAIRLELFRLLVVPVTVAVIVVVIAVVVF